MLRRPNILVVGSFMMDLIAATRRAPREGETVVGLRFTTAPGGKGANQAVQCARLGAQVTMVGRGGDDAFGRLLTGTAAQAGVDVSHVSVDPEESSGVGHITLEVTEHDARNRITVCPGANHTLTVEEIAWLREEIGRYDMLLLQLELPMAVTEAAARWAHEAGVPVMLNPAPAAPLSEELLACVTYLSPNEHEAAALSGHPIGTEHGADEADLAAVTAYFLSRGVQNLLVTLGENGSLIANASGTLRQERVAMPHVADTTAAGDSFVAAFCTGVTAGLTQKDALAFASFAAGITVSRMGAMPSIPTVEEVQALMRERGFRGFDPAMLDALKGE